MRWNYPDIGDSRWRRKFLFLPRQIGRQKVWLEWIWVQEVFRSDYGTMNQDEWVEIDWRFDRPESPVMRSQGYSESREN